MDKESIIDELDIQALDILESGEDISDAQLQQIKEDAALRQHCQELQDLKTVCRKRNCSTVDVEERLRMFHSAAHSNEHENNRYKTIIISILAAAAVFAGCLFLLKPAIQQKTDNQIFTADNNSKSIIITDEHGDEIPLSSTSSQRYSISLADYRKAMSGDANIESLIVNVPYGKSTDISLPDGSVAYLHPGSKLTFPTSFTGGRRVVKLEGEAYFKVTKDAAHPFVVMTDKIETTVLGTEFNVKDDEVTLITGSVRVSNPKTSLSRTLIPGEQLKLDEDKFTVNNVDTQPYVFWRDGYLYYDNVELCDIMKAIGENYNMTVEFGNPKMMHLKMRFITERNGGIDTALNMMNRMKKVNVYKSGNKIIVE